MNSRSALRRNRDGLARIRFPALTPQRRWGDGACPYQDLPGESGFALRRDPDRFARYDRRVGILVTDFDGTITETDIYMLIRARYMDPALPEYFDEYRRGRMTHFEAMAHYLSHGPTTLHEWEILMRDAEPDPGLRDAVGRLQSAGWTIVIASAGGLWYIDRMLATAHVNGVVVHANPGAFAEGVGLRLQMPAASPFVSESVGVNKEAVVRDAMLKDDVVAFAGDGPPDVPAALLVKPELRFARGWLAAHLRERGEPFVAFRRWSEIVPVLQNFGPAKIT